MLRGAKRKIGANRSALGFSLFRMRAGVPPLPDLVHRLGWHDHRDKLPVVGRHPQHLCPHPDVLLLCGPEFRLQAVVEGSLGTMGVLEAGGG